MDEQTFDLDPTWTSGLEVLIDHRLRSQELPWSPQSIMVENEIGLTDG